MVDSLSQGHAQAAISAPSCVRSPFRFDIPQPGGEMPVTGACRGF
jgi:hypothetical protein